MIVDFDDYRPDQDLVCDLCVVGSGPAGLAVARQFVDGSDDVVVLEGGGVEYDEESTAIYEGDVVGRPYYPLDVCRQRFFGGSSNHWGGWCRPMEDLDFRKRAWVPDSGWPIGPEALAPYLRAAAAFLGMDEPQYGPEAADELGGRLLELAPELFLHRFWNELTPEASVAELHQAALRDSQNVTVLLNANLVDIALNDNHTRTGAFRVQGRGDRRRSVVARHFVLALGGLENPRILLNANRQIASGIGNQHDLVGRFFMDHLRGQTGRLVAAQPEAVVAAYGPVAFSERRYVLRPAMCLSPQVQRDDQILNHSFHIGLVTAASGSSGFLALRSLYRHLRRGEFDDLTDHMGDIVGDFGGMSGALYRGLIGQPEVVDFQIYSHGEQSPNPDSRVYLTDRVDRLGLRRIALDWRLTNLDRSSFRRAVDLVSAEIGRLGAGRVRLAPWLGHAEWLDEPSGGPHHMGTTKMADDDRNGVVSADCTVFGVDNLHIAGSSVFPAGGAANPTLTIVQLALRLADRLKNQLRSGV